MLRNFLFCGLLISAQYLYAVDDRFAVTSGALNKANIAKSYPYNPAIPRYLYKLLPNFRDSMHQAAYWLQKSHNNSIVAVSKKSIQLWNDNELWLYE